MPKFICLTDNDGPVWVDPERIVWMKQMESEGERFTRVQFGYGSHRDVRQTPEQIQDLISMADEVTE
jgi:hypothetical protein